MRNGWDVSGQTSAVAPDLVRVTHIIPGLNDGGVRPMVA